MGRVSLSTSCCLRSVSHLQQPAIGFVAVTGAFGEDLDPDVAAFGALGQLPLDQVPVRDGGDSDRNFFFLNLYGDGWPVRGFGGKK